jgi:hypothetical protein
MFNNRLYRYSSLADDINYFYDALRKEGIDSEKLLDEYLDKIFTKMSLPKDNIEKSIGYFKILFHNPVLVRGVDKLLENFNHYNLDIKAVFAMNNEWSEIGKRKKELLILNRGSYDAYKVSEMRNRLLSYKILKSWVENPEELEKYNKTYNMNLSLEEAQEDLSNLEQNISSYKKIVSEYDASENEIKSKITLPPYNHSILELETVSKECQDLINNMGLSIDRTVDYLDWVKFFTSKSKYLKPLFNKIIIDEKEEQVEIKDPNLDKQIIDILNLDKDKFIEEYLKISNLENLSENREFIKKLEKLWVYSQEDSLFINKLNDFENIILNNKRVDYDEISYYLGKRPFSIKNKPEGKNVYWYYDNKDLVSDNSEGFKKFHNNIKYIISVGDGFLPKDEEYERKKNFCANFSKLRRDINKFSKYWTLLGAQDTKYGVSLQELFEIHYKLKNDFSIISPKEINNLTEYFDNPKFKKIFDAKCEYNKSEKFELLLENFIAGNVTGRMELLNNMMPNKFLNLVEYKFPDLGESFKSNNFSSFMIDEFDLYGIGQRICKSLDITERDLKKVQSKHFSEFYLTNSSFKERDLFENFEKLDLYPVPASQVKNIIMYADEEKSTGFRIDFLLPCNVRKYSDDENFTLEKEVIFVGEYFGFYGPKYIEKSNLKKEWQNNLEKSVNQKCLHITDIKTDSICKELKDKKIDCKCYPDYVSNNFDIKDEYNKKILFLRSQLHNFIYTYLINELLWHIKYDYSKLNIENLELVKNKNKSYIDEFDELFVKCDDLKASEIARRCSSILSSYDIKFKKEQSKRTANYKVRIK